MGSEHHTTHTIVDVSDVSGSHDYMCQTCSVCDDDLVAECAKPLTDAEMCSYLRATSNPISNAAARRIEALSASVEAITDAKDRELAVVEPYAAEAEKLIFRCVHEIGGIAIEALDAMPDSDARLELVGRFYRATDLQHPVLRHFARIKKIGAAARKRFIDRIMLRPMTPIIVDANHLT